MGIKRGRVRAAVRDGVLRRVLRGVFVRADIADTVETRAAAAALVVGPCSVITDRTAAWIHGIDVLTYAEHAVLPPVESCVLRRSSRGQREGGDAVAHGPRSRLQPHPTRRDALASLDQFRRLHGLTRAELAREAVRYLRRRGVIQLRQLIPLADARAESPRESWTRLAIIDAGLPVPEPPFWVEVDDVAAYRLDLAHPRHRIAIEYDGEEFHARTPAQREHDQRRRGWLEDHGWTVVVVRNGDFTGAGLDRWISELRAALRPAYSNRRW